MSVHAVGHTPNGEDIPGVNRPLGPVMGEVCLPESENFRYEFSFNMWEIILSVRQKAHGISKPKDFTMSILKAS